MCVSGGNSAVMKALRKHCVSRGERRHSCQCGRRMSGFDWKNFPLLSIRSTYM